jgi:hypothetical protein
MRVLLSALFALSASSATSAAIAEDANCMTWASNMLLSSSDACDDLCPQALHFDHYDYRAGLEAAFKSRRGLSAIIAYTGRSTIMGAAGDAQACSLHALLVHWGDSTFSRAAAKYDLKTRERLVGLLDYAAVPDFQARFPRSYALASHSE